MALAYLCSRLRFYDQMVKIADNPLARFFGVIVNHNVRDGSTKEAKAVAEALAKLEIKVHVLPMVWRTVLDGTGYTHPKDLPNFETVARRLRYQLIAKHCCTYGNIATLLMAHHQDDQYETLLMRLLSGHGAAGLLGTRPATDIPECHSIHGAYQSGFVDDQLSSNPSYNFSVKRSEVKDIQARLREEIDPELTAQELADGTLSAGYLEDDFDAYVATKKPVWRLPAAQLEIEDGGITIYRPLLEFGKERLIATCEANGVPWFEDATNHDPTLTRRNAVRHLCKHYALPVALQKPAILAMSNRLQRQAEADEAEVDRLLVRTIVRDFDTTSGTVVVRLPCFRIPRRHQTSRLKMRSRIGHCRRIAELLVKRLIALVTPQLPGPSTSDLQTIVLRLFPSLDDNPSTYPKQPKAFNIANVHFLPTWTSKKYHGQAGWYLSREPYVSARPAPIAKFHGLSLHRRWRRRPDQWRWPEWKSFQLWDGRFWVRLLNRSSLDAIVMPFDENDAKTFRESLPEGRKRDALAALLKLHAPGKVRFTLPAIYMMGDFDAVLKNYENLAQVEKAELLDEADAQKEWDNIVAIHGPDVKRHARNWEVEKGLSSPDRPIEEQITPTSWRDYYIGVEPVLVALPTLGIERPGLRNWIKYEFRYKSVDRDLLEKSAKKEEDLARYERARRRATKTSRQTRADQYAIQYGGRPARDSHRRHIRSRRAE